MFWIWMWVGSIIATLYIAEQKKLGVGGYFFISLLTGPVAVIVALLMPANNKPSLVNESPNTITLQQAKLQLHDLKLSLNAFDVRIKDIESLIQKLSESSVETPRINPIASPVINDAPIFIKPDIVPQEPILSVKKSDMELDFARNWLSKIGIAVLALGIAFLISYTFKYFGPALKITFGFVIGGVLYIVGTKLETKDKLMNFGRALLGGAWAIIYFTTYAMYHFEASRIIYNQTIESFLLVLVVILMIFRTLRYKSEEMMALAIFVAYMTSTVGQITSFTMVSNLFLATLTLFLVYKFQWVRILSLGLVMTYGIHYIWIMPHVNAYAYAPHLMAIGMAPIKNYDLMNLIFLTSYWLVFFIGVHLVRSLKDNVMQRTLATTNFANMAIYALLAYPLVLKLFYPERFMIVLGAGLIYLITALIMKKSNQEKMYISDIVAGVFAITYAISLAFQPQSALLVWLIEIPFLLFIGIQLKENIFRYFSYALLVYVFINLTSFGFPGNTTLLNSLWPTLSMAVCFCLTQLFNKDAAVNRIDQIFDQVISFAASLFFVLWLQPFVHQPWGAFFASLLGWAFLCLSVLIGLKRFRIYAYIAFLTSILIFFFAPIYAASEQLKWFIVISDVLSIFAAYQSTKYIKQTKPEQMLGQDEEVAVFIAAFVLLIFAIHQYAAPQWVSLSLGIASVLLILTGFAGSNKTERMGGMVLLALTLGRVVFIDLSGLDIVFKIITLIVLGVLFLGVSYIYNRFSIKKD